MTTTRRRRRRGRVPRSTLVRVLLVAVVVPARGVQEERSVCNTVVQACPTNPHHHHHHPPPYHHHPDPPSSLVPDKDKVIQPALTEEQDTQRTKDTDEKRRHNNTGRWLDTCPRCFGTRRRAPGQCQSIACSVTPTTTTTATTTTTKRATTATTKRDHWVDSVHAFWFSRFVPRSLAHSRELIQVRIPPSTL